MAYKILMDQMPKDLVGVIMKFMPSNEEKYKNQFNSVLAQIENSEDKCSNERCLNECWNFRCQSCGYWSCRGYVNRFNLCNHYICRGCDKSRIYAKVDDECNECKKNKN